MTAGSKTTIKTYFVTGAKPTQAQFENLIDSYQDYSGVLNSISTQASAGTQGFPLIQSQSSAQFYNAGTIGLSVLQSDTAASARTELGLSSGTTGFVKVTDNDTTDGRLNTKVSAHTGLTQTVTSPSGNEGLRIALDYATTAQAAAGLEGTLPVNTVLVRAAIEGQYVTTAQANTGTLGTGVMNPVLTRNAIIANAFTSANYATTAQAIAGTDATTVINPVLLKNAIGGTNALVLLSSAAAAASTSIDFTSLITSTYSSYRFIISDLRPANTANLLMRTSTNNSTFDNTASDYIYSITGLEIGTSVANNSNSMGSSGNLTTAIQLHASTNVSGVDARAAGGFSGEVLLVNPLGTTRRKFIRWTGLYDATAVANCEVYGTGVRDATTDIDAVRFLFNGANITSGTIRMYGIT